MKKALLFICIFSLVYACNKQKQEAETSTDVYSLAYPSQMPTVSQGRLVFNSENHLKEYYNYLRDLVANSDDDIYSDPDSMLLHLENRLGYTSVRSILNKDYIETSDRGGDEEQEEAWLEADWLKDDIRKSILNQDYEVTIDGMVYIYMSENQIYKFPENNIALIELVREIEKGDDETVKTEITKHPGVELVSGKFEKLFSAAQQPPYEECSLDPQLYVQASDCTPLWRRITGNIVINFEDEQGNNGFSDYAYGTYTFDWGDGTETVVENTNSINIEHVYAAAGSYVTSVTVEYEDPCDWDNLTSVTYDGYETDGILQVHDQVCAGETENSSQDHTQTSGDYRMYAEIWFRSDIFGTHEGAKTVSYEHRWIFGMGTAWWKTRAYVKAEINWHFRNGECQNIYVNGLTSGLETDWCGNCKSKRANKTCTSDSNIKFGEGEVHSYHKIDNDGHVFEQEFMLIVCP